MEATKEQEWLNELESAVTEQSAILASYEMPWQLETVTEKKFGGIAPKKPLISKDHERAYFDSADWVLGKQAASNSAQAAAIESLKPKLKVVACGITGVAEAVREMEEAGLDLWFSLLLMLWSELTRRSVVTADRNAHRKEALAKKKAAEQAAYEAAYYEERRRGEVVQAAAAVRKTSSSSPAFFGEGFVPHPSQHRFSPPEISDSKAAHGDDAVFSPTTTTPTPHVRRPGLGLDLNHSFASTSPTMRRAPVFFGDDPGAGSSNAGRALFGDGGWYDDDDPNGQQVFDDMAGSQYTADEV
ncbi:hypothetical protein ACQ4PT_065928 [Festuca glaucescens]